MSDLKAALKEIKAGYAVLPHNGKASVIQRTGRILIEIGILLENHSDDIALTGIGQWLNHWANAPEGEAFSTLIKDLEGFKGTMPLIASLQAVRSWLIG